MFSNKNSLRKGGDHLFVTAVNGDGLERGKWGQTTVKFGEVRSQSPWLSVDKDSQRHAIKKLNT